MKANGEVGRWRIWPCWPWLRCWWLVPSCTELAAMGAMLLWCSGSVKTPNFYESHFAKIEYLEKTNNFVGWILRLFAIVDNRLLLGQSNLQNDGELYDQRLEKGCIFTDKRGRIVVKGAVLSRRMGRFRRLFFYGRRSSNTTRCPRHSQFLFATKTIS